MSKTQIVTLAYQLGYYVGEQIVDQHLVTLSCDEIQTRKTISVNCAEGDEYRRLNNVWFEKRTSKLDSESEWQALRAHHTFLKNKYIPVILECYFSVIHIENTDLEEFKKGIGCSLWDSDCSYYSTKSEDIDVKTDEDRWFTIITLKKA